jgi:hypothetical protein
MDDYVRVQQVVPEYFPPIKGEVFAASVNKTGHMYLPILKNAHSWATKLLETNLQFVNKKYFPREHAQFVKFIIILRDPIERWIAGAAEYLSNYDPTVCREFVSNDNFMKLICDIGRLDLHTSRQLDVFFDIDIKQCVFFKCDSTLESTMHHFIKTVSKRDSVIPSNHYNMIEDGSESKRIAYHALTERLQDKEYFDRVNKYVLPDVKLLEYITENNLWYTAR